MAAASLALNCSFATTAYSTSPSLTPACLANSYTCSFWSSSALGVKFGTCQKTIFFARWAWLVLTSHHGAVVAAAPAAATWIARRRLIPAWVIAASLSPLPLDRAQREPLHDPPLEDQVDHHRRQRAQERRRHHGPPEEDVLDDEQGQPGGDGPDLDAVDEHVGVQELVPGLGEREEGDDGERRQRHGQDDAKQGAQPRAPVDQHRFLQLDRDR